MDRVKLVELPALKLVDKRGRNWTALRKGDPLGGKQIVAAQLKDAGFDVEIINLKRGDEEIEFGSTTWNSLHLTKIASGNDWRTLDARDAEVWGVTVNYLQEREVACFVIRHLTERGGRVVVGGSDALAEPQPYLAAGAKAVVRDKSGKANVPIIDYVLGRTPRAPLVGVMLADGSLLPPARPSMSPQDWPLPDQEIVRATLGRNYWEGVVPEAQLPIGAIMLDLGCDRKCDFCQTPTYKIGYNSMTPERALRWVDKQKEAGAKSIICLSDQFLGRVLWKGGREDVLTILAGIRERGLAVLWGNGLELGKATLGRGMPGGDPSPDHELVKSLWGWDGIVGCAQAYIPGERPIEGKQAYSKLLEWEEHMMMMDAVVRAGVPDITYGVIVGLPEDSRESLGRLTDAMRVLRKRLKAINPALRLRIVPYAIRPLPGTPQTTTLHTLGLIKFRDPAIVGGFWTACADTQFLRYQEISEWQMRLLAESSEDTETAWQGLTAA